MNKKNEIADNSPEELEQLPAHKEQARVWFEELRDTICAAFEAVEDDLTEGPHADRDHRNRLRRESHRRLS